MGRYSVKIVDGLKKYKLDMEENGEYKEKVSLEVIDNFFMSQNFNNREKFLSVSAAKGYRFSKDVEPYISYQESGNEKKIEIIYKYCEYIDFFSKYYYLFKKIDKFSDEELSDIYNYQDIIYHFNTFIKKVDEKTRLGELIPEINVSKKIEKDVKNDLINYSDVDRQIEDNNGKSTASEDQVMAIGKSITSSYKFIRNFIHGIKEKDKERIMNKLGLSKEDVMHYNTILQELIEEKKKNFQEEQLDMFGKVSKRVIK